MVKFYPLYGVTPEDLNIYVDKVGVGGDDISFDDARQAWAWLKDVRKAEEDRHEGWGVGEYSSTLQSLDYIAGTQDFGEGMCEFGNPHEDWPLASDGTGWIRGATPGIGWGEGDRDVEDCGVFYAVVVR